MLKTRHKNCKQLAFSVTIAFLVSFLSPSAFAAASKNTDFLPLITYMLLDDSKVRVDEFGTLIPGKLYSDSELAHWRSRVVSGPHVVRGDAYGTSTTGSYPDYQVILASSYSFNRVDDNDIVLTGISRTDLNNQGLSNSELAEIEFVGDCAVPEPGNGNTSYAWYEFG